MAKGKNGIPIRADPEFIEILDEITNEFDISRRRATKKIAKDLKLNKNKDNFRPEF